MRSSTATQPPGQSRPPKADQLSASLNQAAAALSAGDKATAMTALNTFLNHANTLNAPGPQALLVRDGQALITSIRT
ncbi:FIMAH domain-containing protein [Polymorphospora lycopeni]|uniref:FIMAH domain-containing protein n=1 Tax=Polymorphospora sp. A560 TaxID=3040203 RepID=UPI0035D5161D